MLGTRFWQKIENRPKIAKFTVRICLAFFYLTTICNPIFQPMDELAIGYGGITGSLCHLGCWIGSLIVIVLIHRIFQAEKRKERKALRGREQTNRLAEASLFMFAMNRNVHFWNEIKNAGTVIVLIIVYVLLMVPYVVRVKVDQVMQVSY